MGSPLSSAFFKEILRFILQTWWICAHVWGWWEINCQEVIELWFSVLRLTIAWVSVVQLVSYFVLSVETVNGNGEDRASLCWQTGSGEGWLWRLRPMDRLEDGPRTANNWCCRQASVHVGDDVDNIDQVKTRVDHVKASAWCLGDHAVKDDHWHTLRTWTWYSRCVTAARFSNYGLKIVSVRFPGLRT